MKNKKKVVVVIGIVAILLVSIIGYLMYQKRAAEQAAVEEQFNQIYAIGTDFSAAKSREEQLDILKKTVNERNDYIQSKNNTPEVSGKYDSVILGMQGIFTKEYDTILEENTLEHVDESEDTEKINAAKENLTQLLSMIDTEKDYTLSDEAAYKDYQGKISKLTESYGKRLNEISEQEKAAEEEKKKAEAAAESEKQKAEGEAQKAAEEEYKETHYENDYFSVDTSSDWIGDWKMTEEDQSTNGILCRKYVFDYHPDEESYGGMAEVYVIDMSDDSIPESVYDKMHPEYASEVGTTSFGAYHIFMFQVGGDFFSEYNDHASLTIK